MLAAALAALALAGCDAAGGASGDGAICQGSQPVRWSGRVPVEDASLYLDVRGASCDAPLLIWLHGGPGGAERPLFRLYDSGLERRFVVAYLDQRGAGRSFEPEADPAELTVERHLADLDRVVAALCAGTGHPRVILVGHSWGGALGLLYAGRHPERVAAVVGVAPLIAGLPAQEAARRFVAGAAGAAGDAESLERLAALGAPPYGGSAQLELQELVDSYGGVFHRRPNLFGATLQLVLRGYVTPWEIPRLIEGNEVSLDAMAGAVAELDLRREVPALGVPVVVMVGRYDRLLDPALAEGWLDAIDAPCRTLLRFAGSAHNIPFEEPDAFMAELGRALLAPARPGCPASSTGAQPLERAAGAVGPAL